MDVTVRKYGNIIDVSIDGKHPLPSNVRACLEPALTYTYKQYLRGKEARSIAGKAAAVITQPRRLFSFDAGSKLICGAGLAERVIKLLKENNHTIIWQNKDPKPCPADVYKPRWDLVKKHFSFRNKQEEFIRALIEHPCGAAEAPPAFGKSTCLAAMCLLYPSAEMDIVTKRKDIVCRLRQDLLKYVPNIGQVGGGVKQKQRVTVYTGDSLHYSDGTAHILVGDEAHELMADSYVRELAKYRFSHMYAMSASLQGRMDGTDARMESIFGPTRFVMSYAEGVSHGLIVPIHVDWLDILMPANPVDGKTDPTARLRWGIWRNAHRNGIIAKRVQEVDDDEQVLIIVQTLEHAVHLRQQLPEYTLVYSERDAADQDIAGYKTNNMLPADEPRMTPARRNQLRQDFETGKLKKVIATHVWDTGVDFVHLAVMVRADALASEIKDIQAPGRVCRKSIKTGKQFGLVIDLFDGFDNSFYAKALKRRRNYEERGWLQFRNGKRVIM